MASADPVGHMERQPEPVSALRQNPQQCILKRGLLRVCARRRAQGVAVAARLAR